MGNFNAGIDDVVDVYVRVVAVADTDDVVVLTCFRIFELSCNLWDAVPPQQRPYLPHVSVSKVAESSTFSIAELSNLLQAVLPLALVAPVHLYDPWLLGMFLSENIWVSEIVIVPSPPTIHNDG